MEKKNSFMQTKPVFSLLLSMSVPMMLSMLIQSLYNIVDSIYVSRLGTDALTAVSLAYPLQNAILSASGRNRRRDQLRYLHSFRSGKSGKSRPGGDSGNRPYIDPLHLFYHCRSDDLRTVFKTFYRQPENIKRRIHIYGNRTLPFFRLSFSNCI